MPAGRTTTYTAQLDASQIRREAAGLRSLFENQLRSVKIDFLQGANLRASVGDLRAIRTEMDAITGAADRASQEARELSENIRRANEEGQRNRGSEGGGAASGLGALGNSLKGAVAGYLTVQGVRQIAEGAAGLSDLATQARRTNLAFVELSGGEAAAAANLEAVRKASGGAIDTLTGQQVALTAINLKLASNAQELTRVTEAARVVSLLSPVINDVESAITELGLASANLSFRRLDQLALSVEDVKDRMKALKAENSGLSDSQAFLNASVDALLEKGGALIGSLESQATGVETLRTTFAELRLELAERLAPTIDELARDLALGLGGGGLETLQSGLRDKSSRERTKLGGIFSTGSPFGGDELAQQADDAALALQQILDLEAKGVQISDQFRESTIDLARGIQTAASATDEHAAALDAAFSVLQVYADGGVIVAQAMEDSSVSAEENADAIREAANAMREADPAASALISTVQSLALTMENSGITAENFGDKVDELNDKLANLKQRMAGINSAQSATSQSVLNAALGVADIIGLDKAKELANQQIAFVEGEFSKISGAAIATGDIPSASDLAFLQRELSDTATESFSAIREGYEAQQQAEKEAQREAERANKAFIRDYERAAAQAAREMEASLRSVPGLFGTTQVTQEDFDLQELGLRSDSADEFLRRLRAEVESGEDLFPDVSIDKAREALQRIGASVGDGSSEAIVKALDRAWQDSSLFSDIQNIEELINPAAVQQALDQAAKAKEGQKNLLDYFGLESPEDAGAAVAGVGNSIASSIKEEITAADVGGAVGTDIATKTQAAVVNSLNLDVASVALSPGFGVDIAGQIAGEIANADLGDVGGQLLTKIETSFRTSPKLGELSSLGTNISASILEGYLLTDLTQSDLASPILRAVRDDFLASPDLVELQNVGGFLNTAVVNGYRFKDLSELDLANPIIKAIADDFVASPELISLQELGGFLNTVVINGYRLKDLSEIDLAAPIVNKISDDFTLPDHLLSLQRLGEGMAGSIAFFFKPSDEADFAAPIMTKMQADFVSETVTVKLSNIGKTLSQRIHDEFIKETGRQDWVEAVVDTISSQAVNNVADAVAGAAGGQ